MHWRRRIITWNRHLQFASAHQRKQIEAAIRKEKLKYFSFYVLNKYS